MTKNKSFRAMLLGLVLAASPIFAQEEAYKNEVSVQGFGSFVKNTVNNGVPQGTTNSAGVLTSYRFFFSEHHGVEVNYGFANNTQNYGSAGSLASVDNRSHELSAAYVLRFPVRRVTPFALAGVGGVIFDPKNLAGTGIQARPAFVYGGGADFSLTRHVFMRAQYRGLVYNSPTYDLANLTGTARITHNAEPSLGFGFRF